MFGTPRLALVGQVTIWVTPRGRILENSALNKYVGGQDVEKFEIQYTYLFIWNLKVSNFENKHLLWQIYIHQYSWLGVLPFL